MACSDASPRRGKSAGARLADGLSAVDVLETLADPRPKALMACARPPYAAAPFRDSGHVGQKARRGKSRF